MHQLAGYRCPVNAQQNNVFLFLTIQLNHKENRMIRTINLTTTNPNIIRNISKEYTLQYDDRLEAFYLFLFPTPIVGIVFEKEQVKIFPVGGNGYLQKQATEAVIKVLTK